MDLIGAIHGLLAFMLRLIVAAIELLWWLVYLLRQARDHIIDALRAWRRTRGGELRCDCGSVVETEGVFECGACGYTYEGTVWQCGNPECGATTSYTECRCGLSVRSPYRWGRP